VKVVDLGKGKVIMLKKIFTSYAPIVTSLAIALAFAFVHPVAAAPFDGTIQGGADSARGTDQSADLFGSSGIFSTITNVLLFVLGAISVIMIIIGGLRYVVSGGNSANVTAAKNTILYAIVGVIIAILSYAIINFVLGSFTSGGDGGGTNV
jgi:hypothetical protein